MLHILLYYASIKIYWSYTYFNTIALNLYSGVKTKA